LYNQNIFSAQENQNPGPGKSNNSTTQISTRSTEWPLATLLSQQVK